jgi:UV DNA damage endonuclease
VDFHPDHFVLLNSPKAEILIQTLHMLNIHRRLLEGFGLDPTHRCVLHVGGGYQNKEKALEQFIHNWGLTPSYIQSMIMLENDDKVFTVQDTLYLCEKLGIPLVYMKRTTKIFIGRKIGSASWQHGKTRHFQ